jgi:hypothetical protein
MPSVIAPINNQGFDMAQALLSLPAVFGEQKKKQALQERQNALLQARTQSANASGRKYDSDTRLNTQKFDQSGARFDALNSPELAAAVSGLSGGGGEGGEPFDVGTALQTLVQAVGGNPNQIANSANTFAQGRNRDKMFNAQNQKTASGLSNAAAINEGRALATPFAMSPTGVINKSTGAQTPLDAAVVAAKPSSNKPGDAPGGLQTWMVKEFFSQPGPPDVYGVPTTVTNVPLLTEWLEYSSVNGEDKGALNKFLQEKNGMQQQGSSIAPLENTGPSFVDRALAGIFGGSGEFAPRPVQSQTPQPQTPQPQVPQPQVPQPQGNGPTPQQIEVMKVKMQEAFDDGATREELIAVLKRKGVDPQLFFGN